MEPLLPLGWAWGWACPGPALGCVWALGCACSGLVLVLLLAVSPSISACSLLILSCCLLFSGVFCWFLVFLAGLVLPPCWPLSVLCWLLVGPCLSLVFAAGSLSRSLPCCFLGGLELLPVVLCRFSVGFLFSVRSCVTFLLALVGIVLLSCRCLFVSCLVSLFLFLLCCASAFFFSCLKTQVRRRTPRRRLVPQLSTCPCFSTCPCSV